MNEAEGRERPTEVAPDETAGTSARGERNRALIERALAGDEAAMEALVVENAGLVRSLALRFCGRGTELEDLIQIGTIGMIKARRVTSIPLNLNSGKAL